MLPYIILVFFPLLFSYVSIEKRGKKQFLKVGKSVYIKENNLILVVFFTILLILLMVRNESVGRDLSGYKYIFMKNIQISEIFKSGIEPFFALFNLAIKKVSESYQFYIATIAVLTIVPIAKLYCEERKHSYLKLILFVNMSTFVMLFSGIRQAWAISLGVIAFQMVRKKEFWKYLLICVIAIGIHTSAFMLLFMYPLYYATFYKKHLVIIIPLIGIVFVFNKNIFSMLGVFLSIFTKYEFSIANTNAYGTLILFLAFLILSYIITDERKMDRELIGLRNFLILAIIIQCFVPLHSLAMRMGYYYIIFIPLTIAKILECRKIQYSQVAKLIEIVICIFFTVVFVRSIYLSYVTGISALDTVPYIPFWVE